MLMPDVVTELQDMRYLDWTRIRKSSGTAGSLLKSQSMGSEGRIYYKLSGCDSASVITGHESVNEIIADRLLTILGIEHLSYQLIHATVNFDSKDHETWLCASEDFKLPGDSKMPLDDYFDMHKEKGEAPLDFCLRMGWESYIYEMLVVDYLILNRDRHGANTEILLNRKNGTVRPAPLFDHGLSLLCTCLTPEAVDKFDIMGDYAVQSFVGSRSAYDNLSLIPKNKKPRLRALEERDKELLLKDLDGALSKEHLEKIWNMIWKRWNVFEDL